MMRGMRQLLTSAVAKIGAGCRRLYRDFTLLAETDDAFEQSARRSLGPSDPSAQTGGVT